MSIVEHRIYRLKGTPFEIGFAMGQSLGLKLEANIDRYVRGRPTPGTSRNVDLWRSGALPWLHQLPERFLEEFRGLAQGARLPLQRIAEWAYIEVILSGWCSGVMLTIDNQVWVARNNDIYVPDMWGYVTIREVSGRIPTISFGLEGDVFTPTGINKEKLWLHYNYAAAWDRLDALSTRQGVLPCYAFLVEALETCRTLQDLEALLGRIPRDDGMLLFAVDGKNNACALYECSCTDFYKHDPSGGWLVGTNHYRFHPKAPCISGSLSTISRYARLETLAEGLLSQERHGSPVEELIQILADDGVEARSVETVTAYSNVACPSLQEIWYTFGGFPAASHGNWQKLDWPW